MTATASALEPSISITIQELIMYVQYVPVCQGYAVHLKC